MNAYALLSQLLVLDQNFYGCVDYDDYGMGWLPRVGTILGTDTPALEWDLREVLKEEMRVPTKKRDAASEISEAQRAFAEQFVVTIRTLTMVCGL